MEHNNTFIGRASNHLQSSFVIYLVVFITLWGGSNKILSKIRGTICNYLWSSQEQLTRTRVSWRECCLKKKCGGLGLIDPRAAKSSLLYKWVVKTMEPGESNLQLMLRYRLARFNPQKGRSWGVSLISSPTNNIKDSLALRYGDISIKHGR